MDWRKLFSPSDAAAAANARDVTNTDGALYGGGGIRGVVETPAAPDGSDPHLPEEVKRRQVALLLRYVMTIRVR
jgi:hypothetical protein